MLKKSNELWLGWQGQIHKEDNTTIATMVITTKESLRRAATHDGKRWRWCNKARHMRAHQSFDRWQSLWCGGRLTKASRTMVLSVQSTVAEQRRWWLENTGEQWIYQQNWTLTLCSRYHIKNKENKYMISFPYIKYGYLFINKNNITK